MISGFTGRNNGPNNFLCVEVQGTLKPVFSFSEVDISPFSGALGVVKILKQALLQGLFALVYIMNLIGRSLKQALMLKKAPYGVPLREIH